MAEEKNVKPEERYQYIGFEIFGPKPPSFWTSEEERKKYIASVKAQIGSIYRNSVVYSSVITRIDRIFILIASALLIIAPFLTWIKVHTLYGPVSYTGLFGIFNRSGYWFYVKKMDGSVVPLTVYLLAVMALASLFFGVWTLQTVYRKAASETIYLARLKKTLKMSLYPFMLFLFIVLLGLIGQRIPFGNSLGISELHGSYSIVTLIQFSSAGLWMAVFGFLLNFSKSKDL
jgi:hypothetical protein